ncbi:MAG: hypothetical protein ACK5PS_10970 [Desulfopila sp.]
MLACSALVFAQNSTPTSDGPAQVVKKPDDSTKILASLLELRHNLEGQVGNLRKKMAVTTSEAEKSDLENEINRLNTQLSENINDFERIAAGVEPSLFVEKPPEQFSWQQEMASLMEPVVKELKRFTVRARHKTELKDKIGELNQLLAAADQGIEHLQKLADKSDNNAVAKQIRELQPEWLNIRLRLTNKLELSQRELNQLEGQEVSLVDSTSRSLRNFFRDRGLYLFVAIVTFATILLIFRLLYRLIIRVIGRMTGRPEERSFRIRLFYVLYRVVSVCCAVIGLFFVLYLAEDWVLLSMAIVFFLGLAWTIRQGVPRLWHEGRLMLNFGSVREKERVILHGVPWRVESINVFCKLVNPALETELRIPIENLIGLSSRPYDADEPWFPCRKGDWVVVGSASRARVVSLSHEQVELVERGGRHKFYPTEAFLQACPANLSRNFRLRVLFGVSYDLQARATNEIPVILNKYIGRRLEEDGYGKVCFNLSVEFCQANASSLDLLINADFKGSVADIYKRLERTINRYCVDCCTENGWEIPFPQLTVHGVGQGGE